MAHYCPGSQQREVMVEKEQLARRLMARGLTDRMISAQLRCSPKFVRRVRQAMAE